MKKYLSNLLLDFIGRPKLTYLAFTVAAFLWILAFLVDYVTWNISEFEALSYIFSIGGILFTWVGALSYVFEARRTRSDFRRQIQQQIQATNQISANTTKSIREAQATIRAENERQAYRSLISLQDLRLAVLEDRGLDKYDEQTKS